MESETNLPRDSILRNGGRRKLISDPVFHTSLPGGNSECEPPDPIPNSEVKPLSADDSVGVPM